MFKNYIMLITEGMEADDEAMLKKLEEACIGGISAIQIREKTMPTRRLLHFAQKVRKMTADYGVKLLINERVDIALSVQADGVHLPENSLPIAAVRALSPHWLVGQSVHSIDRGMQAEKEGADYATFGPVFATPSKAAYGSPQGVSKLAEIAGQLKIPIFALGGITPDNLASCLAAGAAGAAVIRAILSSDDITQTVRRFYDQANR